MRLLTFRYQDNVMAGVLEDESIAPLPWEDIKALIESGLHNAREAAAAAHTIPLSEVTILSPILKPGKIIAIGLNYLDHCLEQGKTPPERPTIFTKFSTAVNHHGGEIRWDPNLTQMVDYEAELAVVIGKNLAEGNVELIEREGLKKEQTPTDSILDAIMERL